MNSLDHIRHILDRHHSEGEGAFGLISRFRPQAGDRFWIGLLQEDRSPFLRIELDRSEIPAFDSSRIQSGIEFRVFENDSGVYEFNLDLTLREVEYRDVFVYFINDIIEKIENSPPKSFRNVLASAIELWESFLTTRSRRGLTDSEVQGLWGELWFLRRLISDSRLSSAMVGNWFGPDREIHDFIIGDKSFEIKTHSGKNTVLIANEWQLDARGLDLSLVTLLVRKNRNQGGDTLPALVDELYRMIGSSPNRRAQFTESLMSAGYHEMDKDLYTHASFKLKNVRVFTIRDGFPRIDHEMLPDGIREVKYSLDLSACGDFEMSLDELLNSLR